MASCLRRAVVALTAAGLLCAMAPLPVAGAQTHGNRSLWPPAMDRCAGSPAVVVASDGRAQSDVYAAAVLAGAIGSTCIVDAGTRDAAMPAASLRSVASASDSVYVVGGTAAIGHDKETQIDDAAGARRVVRISGNTRWSTAQLVGQFAATGEATASDLSGAVVAHRRTRDGALWPLGLDACAGAVPVAVASDASAQSDIYAAVTLAGVVGTSCLVDAGHRYGSMPVAGKAALLDSAASGYVVGGTASVGNHKIAGMQLQRLTGSDRWETARNVGGFAAGTFAPEPSPTVLVKVVTHGYNNGRFCALRLDGAVRCGQAHSDTPSLLLSGTYIDVALQAEDGSEPYICAVERRGELLCWDWDEVQGLGAQLPTPAVRFVSIQTGSPLTPLLTTPGSIEDYLPSYGWCGVTSGSTAICGGFRGSRGEPASLPVLETRQLFGAEVESVSTNEQKGDPACALLVDRSVQCRSADEEYMPSINDARGVAVGPKYGCALVSGGDIECWWHDSDVEHECGFERFYYGLKECPHLPIPPAGGRFRALAAGGDHVCAIRTSGEVRCSDIWGERYSKDVFGSPTHHDWFDLVHNRNGAYAIQVLVGASRFCEVLESGSARCNGKGFTEVWAGPGRGFERVRSWYLIEP